MTLPCISLLSLCFGYACLLLVPYFFANNERNWARHA